jgi:hypothetical protein
LSRKDDFGKNPPRKAPAGRLEFEIRVSKEAVVTRSHRAIQLPFAFLAAFLFFAVSAAPAEAGIIDFLKSVTGQSADTVTPAQPDADQDLDEADQDQDDVALGEMPEPTPKPVAASATDSSVPTVEWAKKHLYCVEYARIRSGLQIFGDAKYWWGKAADLYARATQPVADAVMVFSGSKRIRRGHVAVVTAIISPREIKVDHANWQNQGEIDLNMPVLDVSKNNDWSQVRVWNPRAGQYGARVYAVSGFIERPTPVTSGS